MTNKELSQKIRSELKNNGYNTKMVGVSVRDSLYDTRVKITIKNAEVDKREVEKIVNQYEVIDRDVRTGEILNGCNIYVYIEYAEGVFNEVIKPYIVKAAELYGKSNECVKVDDDVYLLNINNRKEIRQQKPGDYCGYIIYNVEHLAEALYKLNQFKSLIF